MNTHLQPHRAQNHRMIARKVSIKRRYGASMPVAPSDRLGRRSTYASGRGWPRDPRRASDMDQCHARLSAMPADFLDWVDAAPAWPEGARECLGEA